MNTSNQPPESDTLGFFFHHSKPPMVFGSPQLDVNIRQHPTGEHFDPESMRLSTLGDHNQLEHTRLHHPWPGRSTLQVVLGEVTIKDRNGKMIEAFTFGGTLNVQSKAESTHCELSSPVPIIDLRDEMSNPYMLAEETIALIAHRRAKLEQQPGTYEKRMVNANVADLFYAILKSLEQKFTAFPQDDRLTAREFLIFLRHQIEQAPEALNLVQLPAGIEEIV